MKGTCEVCLNEKELRQITNSQKKLFEKERLCKNCFEIVLCQKIKELKDEPRDDYEVIDFGDQEYGP